jgi:hypothetical protein
MIADFAEAEELFPFCQILYAHKGRTAAEDLSGQKAVPVCHDHFISSGIDPFHVGGLSQRKAKALSLADGIMDDALMPSQDLSLFIREVSISRDLSFVLFLDKVRIGPLRYKADLLGIGL